jgi:P27 family predicted phage terminase small subunit
MPRDLLTPTERAVRGSRDHPGRIAGAIAPAAKRPTCPRGLELAGRRVWRQVWAEAQWLTGLDALAVEMVCRSIDDLAAVRTAIANDGRVVRGSKGQPVSHPGIREARAIEADILNLMEKLGLSPTGRRRLGIETREPGPPDPMEAWLAGVPDRPSAPVTRLPRRKPTTPPADALEALAARRQPGGSRCQLTPPPCGAWPAAARWSPAPPCGASRPMGPPPSKSAARASPTVSGSPASAPLDAGSPSRTPRPPGTSITAWAGSRSEISRSVRPKRGPRPPRPPMRMNIAQTSSRQGEPDA